MTETCIMGLIKFVVADSVHLSVFNMMDHKEVNSTTRKLHRAITGTDKTRVSGAKDCSVFATKYRVSQEEWTKLRESVPYVKLHRYNPKHLYPKLNGYGDNGHRKVWASGVFTYCKPSVTHDSSTAQARQREANS